MPGVWKRPLDNLAFTGWLWGQMLPSGSTHGASFFFGAAFFAAGFLATAFFTGSSGSCNGSSPTVMSPGSADATTGPTSGSGTRTGSGVGTAASSGGHADGVGASDAPGEPRSRIAEDSGFGRRILASANPMPTSSPSHRPIRNVR